MRRSSKFALAAVAVLALGAAACSEAEQDRTDARADAAGAREAAQEVDEATDEMARDADRQKAETAADNRGN